MCVRRSTPDGLLRPCHRQAQSKRRGGAPDPDAHRFFRSYRSSLRILCVLAVSHIILPAAHIRRRRNDHAGYSSMSGGRKYRGAANRTDNAARFSSRVFLKYSYDLGISKSMS